MQLLRQLLLAGRDPDSIDDDGYPALAVAASRGQLEAMRVLLAAGASPDARDGSRQQPPALGSAGGPGGGSSAAAEGRGASGQQE